MRQRLSIAAALGAVAIGSPALADDPYVTDPDTPPTYPTTVTTTEPTTEPTTYVEPAETYETDVYGYGWNDPRMSTGIGVGMIVGGGVSGFTDDSMRDVVKNDVGGMWNARVTIGTHIPIGVDLTYLGTASELETLGGLENGTLIGTTLEGALRYNILPQFAWNPYVFAGLGWQRYDVTDQRFATADTGMLDRDDMMTIPLGAGLAFRDLSGFVVDLRGTFRAVTDNDLLREPAGTQADLHSWEANAAIGYEF